MAVLLDCWLQLRCVFLDLINKRYAVCPAYHDKAGARTALC